MKRQATAVAALALAVLACGRAAPAATEPQVTLSPAIVQLRHAASIAVAGLDAARLEVRLEGATTSLGKPLPWTPLRRSNGIWHATLPLPELRGIYPVLLRAGPGSPVLRSDHWLLRVFARGTRARPLFSTPEGVARWWVTTVPAGATLVALKRWPLPAFDRRDPRLHTLLVLAYTVAGRPAKRDRLGIFVTAVREGYHGRWRLLEATAAP